LLVFGLLQGVVVAALRL